MDQTNKQGVFKFMINELKPKGKVFTFFNVIAFIIIVAAAFVLVERFKNGLGAVTHSSQDYPWGLWINFNVITGVASAGGAFVVTFMVYVLGLKKYKPIVRATVLYALLAYVFYMGALLLDLGRPWKVINPLIGNSFGTSAVLFLVAWHFLLYTLSLFFEFYPTVTEWLSLKRQRKFVVSITLGVVIFGILISSLHQAGLGALFLIGKAKIHPLWYTENLPILFFISCIFGGLSVVIIVESIAQRAFKSVMSFAHKSTHRGIIISLARVCSVALFVYFSMQMLVLVQDNEFALLNTSWGYWYLLEMIGFVLLPCFLFLLGYNYYKLTAVRTAAVIALLGIVLNRLNVTTIAFKWYDGVIPYPTLEEVIVSVAVIIAQILVFRWVVRRMPVYKESPTWVNKKKHTEELKLNDKQDKKWKILAQ